MAKTRIQQELREKRRQEIEAKRQQEKADKKNLKQIWQQMTMRGKVVLGILFTGIIAGVVIVNLPKPKEVISVVEDTRHKGDNYYVDDEGNVEYINGQEIVNSLTDKYRIDVKTSMTTIKGTVYEGNYTVEVDGNTVLCYGTECGESYDTLYCRTEDNEYYMNYNKDTGKYVEDGVDVAYKNCIVNADTLIERILCGDNLRIEGSKLISTVSYYNYTLPFSANIPEEYTDEEYETIKETELQETLELSLEMKNNIIYIEGKNENRLLKIEITNIDKLFREIIMEYQS